tara:strand:- start:14388 stop:14600 length:213 start_codon:yes stop_codon:yes gene_type:complete
MENVEKLRSLNLLGVVRQRLGTKDAESEKQDVEINSMTNTQLMEAWCGWYLGDGSWWTTMKRSFDNLEKL